ncbi:S1 RNA-binding domain-containing protein [Merismopedia glauca]|uniref:S1 motif domain-containing protein n=2 Tax=Merismopedia TaxID=53402 RepID=A0A2T1C7G8_9CYAN|nr:S1 RNA-binding domain-containing protein [Merismopedia glauca]PSB04108.1 hypothetical protein C7B64_05420 [Merismopedia glauca CCAP 1448/3]
MHFQLDRFQPGDMVTGKIIALEDTCVFVDFGTDRSIRIPLSELSMNEIQNPEDALTLNEVREFLVVGNYDGKRDIFFSHCSPKTLQGSDRLYERAYELASFQCGHFISKENFILHTKIIGVGAGGVSARLQWFASSQEHPPTISFSIRQLEIKKAWERLRQLQAHDVISRSA